MHNWWARYSATCNHVLVFLIVFTLPINLFYQIDTEGAYLRGLLVDYLIRKIYLHQVLLLVLAALNWRSLLRQLITWARAWQLLLRRPTVWVAVVLVGGLLWRQLSSPLPAVGVSQWLSLGAGGALVYWLARRPPPQTNRYHRTITRAALTAIAVQSALAYAQFTLQHSLFPYWLLGESNLHNLAHISRGQFFDIELILPYASAAHPNILAGCMTLLSLIVWQQLRGRATWQRSLLLGNLLLILGLTQSLSAAAALLAYALWRSRLPRWLLAALAAIIIIATPLGLAQLSQDNTHPSLQRRISLNQAAWQMWQTQPLWGVGLQQFTTQLETYAPRQEIVRFVQPVHHVPLLILSEGGLWLVITLMYLAYLARHQLAISALFVPIVIFSLDHYLLTQSGMWLLLLLFLLLARSRTNRDRQRG